VLVSDPDDQTAIYRLIQALRKTGQTKEIPELLQRLAKACANKLHRMNGSAPVTICMKTIHQPTPQLLPASLNRSLRPYRLARA
jgi:hypothetical protein